MPIALITAWDGIEYAITAAREVEALADGRRLMWWTVESPDDDALVVSAVVPVDYLDGAVPIFTPADWQDVVVMDAADIDTRRWVEIGTGAPAVMADGLPYLSPFDAGPDARLGSYGQ